MEKNKNRTDLLAAGRKKLQQYRQKKDGKGSKFSGKAGKSERDADAAADAASSVAKPAEVKLQVPGGERSRSDSNDGLVDSSALHSRENSEAGDIDAANSALLSVSVLPETDIVEATLAAPAELPLEDSGVCEAELSSSGGNERDVDSSLPNEGGSTCAVDTVMVRDSSLETVIAEAKSTHADLSVPLDLVNASEVVATAVEVECMNGEDQEADCSGSKQINISNVVELEGDGRPDLSRLDESADAHVGAVSGDMGKEGTTGETEKTSEPNDVSASVGVTNEVEEVQKGDGHSVSAEPLVDSDESSAVSPELMNQRREDVMVHYSDVFSDSQGFCAEEVQADMSDKMVDMERSVSKDDSFAISLESKVISGADMSSFDLSQLAEVVRGLGEDEFRFLLMTRELATGGQWGKTGGLSVQERGFSDVLERLKEELYLTNCAKDIFHMQLAEQLELQMDFDHQRHQLIDEISIARASLIEVQGKNESLADELAWCRSELQVISSGREELQKKFHFAKAECEEFFARADELQFRLESSQKELSNVSTELADCKGLVAALQIENENLNGCLTSLQLLQAENINSSVSLALMTEERMKLEEEKKSFAVENDNLLTGLADCKGLVAALQVENANLNGTLTLVTEGREKLAEEKEFFVHETKKLSTELVGCKGLVETLQVEIANLNGSVAFVMEERNKLGEEKDYFANENEKQVMELVDCKGLMAGLQVECSKAVDDLKEATLRVEQLTDENAFLTSSLDMYKAKIGELDIRQMKLSSRSEEAGNQVEGSNMSSTNQENVPDDVGSNQIPAKGESVFFLPVLEKPLSGGHAESSPVYQLKLDVYDDFFGFVGLKGRLEQAEKVMHELEKAIEEMHSHSTSLSRSSDKVVAPGVSKLIQAFESKAPVDDHELEEVPSTENQSPADPYLLTKEQTRNMRAVLTELGLEAENASEFFKGERNIAFRELKVQYETLQEQSCCLEEANVELVVLYEIIKQHFCNVEAKKGELLDLYEASRQQEIILKAENTELGKKLTDYKSRISELQRQLDELLRSSDAMSSSINNQMEILQKEVSERASILEQGWNSTVSSVFKAVRKLDASSGNMGSTLLSDTDDNLDLGFHVAASVEAAANLIEDLQEKLEASCGEHVSMCTSYKEMTEKFNEFHEKNEFATGILHMIYGNLWELVNDSCGCVEESESELRNDKLLDPLHFSGYDTLMVQLRKLLGERLQLESINHKLNSDLMDRTKDVEELNKRCLGSDVILKLVEDVEGVIRLEGTDIDTDEPALFLESLIYFLLQKCKEADEQVNLSREELGFKEMKLNELQGQKDHLSFLIIQSENEILIFKESLSRAMEDLKAVRSEIEEKVTELEQSEQRVSSLREKLSIAVAKGKGLIVQRDSLKQSLAETSSELERCWQELQLKDARLLEVETKLKTYSEAGERVDALESELSYIRNSATALRESFLLKDSVLQRIEEILEDLELPEHFHARDIIEKVDWLARSVTGNSLPLPDWDQKGSMGGGSYSDSGFAVMDAWKEDLQPPSNSGEDLRRKYEELQSKFYGLAEQNEMLEQSLMERNNLVQRWEGILDKVNMPSQLRSVEPEDRIEWLGGALSEAVHHCNSLEQKIDNFEMLCGSLTADLEESQRRTSDLEACLQSFTSEKEQLSGSLEILTSDYEKVSEKTALFEVENDKLHNEVTALQEKLDEKAGTEERIRHVEGEIKRLQDLVSDELLDSNSEDVVCGTSSTECLELLLRKLMEKYTNLSLGGVAVDEHITEKANAIHGERRIRDSEDVAGLKKELEEALGDLMHLKGERDRYMENSQSLVREVEALDIKRQELQELLNQEEQKSASVREKLNLAVRKGKSLVQQRDSMRQTIDEVTSEVERLKSEIELRENALSANEQKIKDLTTYQERTEIVESESLFLRYRLAETERILEEKGHTLSMILSALGEIDVGFEFNIGDSVKKVEQIGKLCHDLNVAMTASEHDLSKSKRASELLLAELNEVQERNDGLQEELAKAASELSELSKERDLAEADKHEALSRLEKLSAVLSEERDNQFAELMVLKPVVDQVRKGFFDINNLLGDALSKDLELLHNLEASLKSSLKSSDALPLGGARGGIVFTSSENKENVLSTVSKRQEQFNGNIVSEICSFVGNLLQDFTTEISSFKEKLHKHSFSLNEEVNVLSEIVGTLHKEMASRKHSLESMKGDVIRLESIKKEKDTENLVLCRNISLLYEACKSSVLEIGNWKAQLVGNGLTAGDLRFNLDTPTSVDGGNLFNGLTLSSSEECVRTMVDRLLSVVKDFGNMQAEIVEVSQMEMKSTISNLQKELREKDIQKDRICVELVSQIKEAEATAMSYLQELQPAKARIHELEKQVEDVMVERSMLQQSVKELQDREATSIYLQERVGSLTDALAAKEQEIEALMQALDAEEAQMEDLTNKTEELERALKQKNLDFENAETFRVKAMKKLSITVSKFDELHNLSASLLSEVENLQSQLLDRDAEISFLRQEVTRCTNDALATSQMSNKRNSDDLHDLVTWLDSMVSRVQLQDVHFDDKSNHVLEFKEILQKQIMSIISELEDLQAAAQSRDNLLQVERSRVEELARIGESLENSLREKESQLTMLRGVVDPGQGTSMTSEIVEVEPIINKWSISGPSVAPQVRSLRKVNNDQVAIVMDMDPGSGDRLEDEDDDKAHGFKSLTTSKIIPRFTRPVTDMIDGLWVSCDRALMRQPAVRLGVIIYWVVLHALLATFVV